MKKVLAMILALVMLLSLGSLFAFADDEPEGFDPYAAPDEATVRVASNEHGTEAVGYWLNRFDGTDEDSLCTGYGAAVFNAAAPVKEIVFRYLWAGKSENGEDCDIRFEIFPYDTDFATSYTKDPVYSVERHYDFDKKLGIAADAEYCIFKPESPLPAGKYVIRFSQIGDKGPSATNSRYIVLPSVTSEYPPTVIDFDGTPFGFMVDFEKKDGVTDYFLPISDGATNISIEKEQTVATRGGGGAFCFIQNHGGEYAVLTPVIPEGKSLYSINFIGSPTWMPKENSNVDIYVYKWKGDYDESVEGKCLFEDRIEGHQDNSDLIIKFEPTTLRYGVGTDNRYLIVIQACEDQIGYWSSDEFPTDWAFFGNAGEELEIAPALKCTYASVGDLGPEPTEAPTEVPTEKPTAAPTEEPVVTEAPKATDAPKATEKADDKAKTDDSSNVLPIIIIAACALVVIACVVVVIAKKKKK